LKNILVIFEATEESTEGLALALGLGAVQEGANIRLRHLNPSVNAKLAHQSYGRLKADDLSWAEGVAIVLETGELAAFDEMVHNLDQFSETRDTASRVAYISGQKTDEESLGGLRKKLERAGFRPFENEIAGPAMTAPFMTQIGQCLAGEKP
jgi:hypothetical protein